MTAAVTGAGFAAGVVAKAADESGINWAADLGTHPAIWVAALSVIARFAPTVRWATLRAVGFFVAMCLGYYGWAVVALDFGSGPALRRFLVLWLAMSVTAVPVAAAGMHRACARDGPVSGAVVATVAGLALLTGGAVWRLGLAALGLVPAGFGLRPVQAAADVVVALVIAGVLPRHASTRAWALALLLPAGLVVRLLVDLVSARLLSRPATGDPVLTRECDESCHPAQTAGAARIGRAVVLPLGVTIPVLWQALDGSYGVLEGV